MIKITLRKLDEKDLPLTVKWRNHPDSRQWFFNQEEISLDAQARWYARLQEKEDERFFVIEDDRSVPAGTVSLYNIDLQARTAEYGRMLIDPDRRGEGIARAATREILRFGFITLGLDRIHLEVMEDNVAAVKLYEDVGFIVKNRYSKIIDGKLFLVLEMEITGTPGEPCSQ